MIQGSFAPGRLGNIVCITCYKKEGSVKHFADIKLGRATSTIVITVAWFALLWMFVIAALALR